MVGSDLPGDEFVSVWYLSKLQVHTEPRKKRNQVHEDAQHHQTNKPGEVRVADAKAGNPTNQKEHTKDRYPNENPPRRHCLIHGVDGSAQHLLLGVLKGRSDWLFHVRFNVFGYSRALCSVITFPL